MANSQLTSATAFSPSLEAIKLAASMYNAAREGNKKALETAVLEGMPPNLTNEKGDTLVSSAFDWCLPCALYRSHPGPSEVVSMMVQSTNTLSQLMLSAYYGHADLVKFLIEHGADPNRLNDKRQSPLAGAVFKKLDDVVQV